MSEVKKYEQFGIMPINKIGRDYENNHNHTGEPTNPGEDWKLVKMQSFYCNHLYNVWLPIVEGSVPKLPEDFVAVKIFPVGSYVIYTVHPSEKKDKVEQDDNSIWGWFNTYLTHKKGFSLPYPENNCLWECEIP